MIREGEALPAQGYQLLTACWHVQVRAERQCEWTRVPGGTEETVKLATVSCSCATSLL